MILRINLLRNIGQFDSVDEGQVLPLAPMTLVYSENGRGKTTLTAVLRSLASGDPVPIRERRRLSAANPPHAVIECGDGATAVFQNNAWSQRFPGILVFDDQFVDENVHSGLGIGPHHRQNLHELILGATAVTLNQRLQDSIARIEEHNRQLRAIERGIPASARNSFSIEEYCQLQPREAIDEELLEAEQALAAARRQSEILRTPGLDNIHLPVFEIARLSELLGSTLEDLETTTVQRLQRHFEVIGGGSEEWVAEGMRRLEAAPGNHASCPFCVQPLSGSEIVGHYRQYFGDEYRNFLARLRAAMTALSNGHGESATAGFERAVRFFQERLQYWAAFTQAPSLDIDTGSVLSDWIAARQAILNLLEAKLSNPLQAMAIPESAMQAVTRYDARRQELAVVNDTAGRVNDRIAEVKEQVAAATISTLSDDVTRLRAVKARAEPEIAGACAEYASELAAKEATETERDTVRRDLEHHRAAVFPGYQTAVNLYLSRFNAGFRLGSVTYTNTRGGPACTYDVLIDDTPVSVSTSAVPGSPSFRNVLSAGDRNTLALAFFFASLDQDADLAHKVVVIDDPVSSLDEHRTWTTSREIVSLCERAAQVILLSHNKPFMLRVWRHADRQPRMGLEVVRATAGSTLREWDVTEASRTEHDQRQSLLLDYVTTGRGAPREVARAIRPHLEAYLRVACPEHFPPDGLLGPFVGLAEQRAGTANQILGPAPLAELRDLNEYASRYHHQGWETEPLNDGELRDFVERTLRFVAP